jgi:hypothetical protein
LRISADLKEIYVNFLKKIFLWIGDISEKYKPNYTQINKIYKLFLWTPDQPSSKLVGMRAVRCVMDAVAGKQ